MTTATDLDSTAEITALLGRLPDEVAHEVIEVLALLAGTDGEGLEAVRARAREHGGQLTPELVRAALEDKTNV
jgi:hypothetical protein